MGPPTAPGPGIDRTARVAAICRGDMLDALSASRWLARVPRRLMRRLIERRSYALARQLIAFDERIARDGLARASDWGLMQWAGPLGQHGQPAVPGSPLLLVSNHPGLVDAVALLSRLAAHDVRLLVAERPLFHTLPALQRHLIMITPAGGGRASALRAAEAHLRGGGTVLTYPAGRIEPDPATDLADALAALERWSPSMNWLARRVPELAVQPVAVGDVIASHYRCHWLARRAASIHDRDAVAAALQVLNTRPRAARPRLAIGTPIVGRPAHDLQNEIRHQMTALMHATRPAPSP